MDLLRAMIIPGVVGLVVVALGMYMTRIEKPETEAEVPLQSHETGVARKETQRA
jgi:hypothetical protein